jgi:hypothetical protein
MTGNKLAGDGEDICPPWWPQILWDLHYYKIPWLNNPGGPRNKPPYVNEILSAVLIYSTTYVMEDKSQATKIRQSSLDTISATVNLMREGDKIGEA